MAYAETDLVEKTPLSIKSSVSPEFINGLHAKYLQFLTDKVDINLEIHPMSFARRLQTLNACGIDLMVGLKKGYDSVDNIVYLEPPYETLRGGYYILKSRYNMVWTTEDLKGLTLGITLDRPQALVNLRKRGIKIIPVPTLKSKIRLLLNKRVHIFNHFSDSADAMIKEQGLENEIVRARVQSSYVRQYYFAICKQSALMPHKSKLETIIREAHDNGDFIKIRADHYAESKK